MVICFLLFSLPNHSEVISSLYVCMINIKLKYNFVGTPHKLIVTKLSIRKLGSSSVLIINFNNTTNLNSHVS